MPIAREDQPGFMPIEDVQALHQAATDIANLKEQVSLGGRDIRIRFDKWSDMNSFPVDPTWRTGDFTYVRADETQGGVTTRYTWDAEDQQWVFDFAIDYAAPSVATLSTLGLVMSSTADGKGYVESTGVISVNG